MKAIATLWGGVLLGFWAAAAALGQGEFPLKWVEARTGDDIMRQFRVERLGSGDKSAALTTLPKDLSDRALYFALPVNGQKILAILDVPSGALYANVAGTGAPSPVEPGAVTTITVGAGDSKAQPARVRFFHRQHAAGATLLGVEPAGYMQGEVRLGGQTYRLAVIDTNLNGRYDDAVPLPQFDVWAPTFDMLAFDADQDGTFRFVMNRMLIGEVLPLTHRIRAKGVYYAIQVAPDGSSVHLEKVEPAMGSLDVGCPDAQLSLLSDSGLYVLSGSGGTWPLPAGAYVGMEMEVARTDAAGTKWTLRVPFIYSRRSMGKLKSFEVRAGETLALKAGPPITAKALPLFFPATASRAAPRVFIGWAVQGAADEAYSGGVTKNNAPYQQPSLRVLDSSGTVLFTGRFMFTENYGAWWTVPEGFKGKYRIEVDWEAGPFEVKKSPDEWFTVE